MRELDVVVIGGGTAGLSAALVLARARRKVLVVDSGSPRNAPAASMHGYLSRDGLPPQELLRIGRDEVLGYGGEIVDGSVSQIEPRTGGGFQVTIAPDQQVSARRLLVSTGLTDELPDVPGLRERWARDVLHCPYCHGYEVRDQPLGVLAETAESIPYAQIVRQWSDDVVVFVPPDMLTATAREALLARAIEVVEGTVAGLYIEHDQLTGVEMADGRVIPRTALFVPPRFVPNSEVLDQLGCEVDESGWPTTNSTGLTSVPGVWVAGNLTNPRAQVITAAGEGSAAAIAINADLVDDNVRKALGDLGQAATP